MKRRTPLRTRLAGPVATFGAGTFCAAVVAIALWIAWDPPTRTYFEYAPIGAVCALLVWDRLFPSWCEDRRTALCDALVVTLALMRVFIPPLPFVSGHTLVAAYAALTARRWPLRTIAVVVLVHVLYAKIFASPGWISMLTALAAAWSIARVRRRFAEASVDPLVNMGQ